MTSTIRLAELLDGNVEITVPEAVAIAQQLICDRDLHSRAEAPFGPLTVDSVAVASDGTLRCLHTAATPSAMEVALLLQTLISDSSGRVPGGLRYAIGRALLEVEAPPFDSAEEFSSALNRFEAGDRRDCVSRVYVRAHSALMSSQSGSAEPNPAAGLQPDRRTHQPSQAELRRQLREADLRLYEAQRVASLGRRTLKRRRIRRAPIAACMVAGVALVAAGEYAHVGNRFRSAPPVEPQAPAAMSTPPESAGLPITARTNATATTLDATPQPARTAPRVRPAAVAAPRTGTAGTRTRKVRDTVSSSARARAAARTRQSAAARRSPEQERSDRATLVRLRFEWNNPFR